MQKINNNNYNIWSKQLSQAWDNQDLFKYRRYQNGGSFTTGALTDMIWNKDNFEIIIFTRHNIGISEITFKIKN